MSKSIESNVTLLTEKQHWGLTDEQHWGDAQGNGQLEVIKRYGTKTGLSDLAILLGGYVGSRTTRDGQRAGYVWSASSYGYGNGYVRAVRDNGDRLYSHPDERYCGARPALPSSVASSLGLSEANPSRKISGVDNTEIDVVEYGEYPQTVAFANESPEKADRLTQELEKAYQDDQKKPLGQQNLTGKKYTFDAEKYDACDKPFNAKEHAEYQHNGKRYIRVEAKPYGGDHSVLSNGKKPQTGEVYWVEVQPIEWLRDPSGIYVARQALFAGVQLDHGRYYDGIFKKTDMHNYLNGPFWKEMQPSQVQAAEVSEQTPSNDEGRENALLNGAHIEPSRIVKDVTPEILARTLGVADILTPGGKSLQRRMDITASGNRRDRFDELRKIGESHDKGGRG
ncbi:MAG: hypothetical protein SFW64_03590 [Alphaproteobacteria bacterium]|nr:hypothetical protein [Alphaproteobacteria bacterium]